MSKDCKCEDGVCYIKVNQFKPIKYESPTLRVKKLHPEAKLPTKGTAEAAGWDLYADRSGYVYSGGRGIVSTGISVAIPIGYVGLLCSRSGMVSKTGVHVANQPGIIDSDYRGEVKVMLASPAVADKEEISFFDWSKGDRIAQLVLVPIPNFQVEEVEDLDETARGEGGFGSTGTK